MAETGAAHHYPTELGRDDGVVALALLACKPIDPESEVRRTLYNIDGVALGYFVSRAPWIDKVGPSEAGKEDPRFPTFVDLMLCHRGSTELVGKLLLSVKERAKEEHPYWGSQKLCLRDCWHFLASLLMIDYKSIISNGTRNVGCWYTITIITSER